MAFFGDRYVQLALHFDWGEGGDNNNKPGNLACDRSCGFDPYHTSNRKP